MKKSKNKKESGGQLAQSVRQLKLDNSKLKLELAQVRDDRNKWKEKAQALLGELGA